MALLYSTLPPPRVAKLIYRRTAGGCPVESAEGRVQSAECTVLSAEWRANVGDAAGSAG